VFVLGLLLLALGLIGAFFAVFPPIDEARWGALGVALGCGLSGLVFVYLFAPSKPRDRPVGTERATATVLDAEVLEGSVAGYQMVELTLEVRPNGGVPFQAKRKVSSGRMGRVELGRSLDVVYDPTNPDRIELA
jgi:hypothetical protein